MCSIIKRCELDAGPASIAFANAFCVGAVGVFSQAVSSRHMLNGACRKGAWGKAQMVAGPPAHLLRCIIRGGRLQPPHKGAMAQLCLCIGPDNLGRGTSTGTGTHSAGTHTQRRYTHSSTVSGQHKWQVGRKHAGQQQAERLLRVPAMCVMSQGMAARCCLPTPYPCTCPCTCRLRQAGSHLACCSASPWDMMVGMNICRGQVRVQGSVSAAHTCT